MQNVAKMMREVPELRNCTRVFRDRAHAGEVLADLLGHLHNTNCLILGIPAGGIPVAAEIAGRLNLSLDVAVASKVTLPWNTETGYGAVAFDGTVELNGEYIAYFGLTEEDVRKGVEAARGKVQRRVKRFRAGRPFPALGGRGVVVVDDGLASGVTLRAAVAALRGCHARPLYVAVPTGHTRSVHALAGEVDTLYCANVRGGLSFAVADAYQRWTDVDEVEVLGALKAFA